jgi:DNA-binding NarL/FixJ family response regulator
VAPRTGGCAASRHNGLVPRTVLVVDDHPSFRATARMLLEADGWTVVGEAAGGAEALQAARDLRPDVVLLDVNLPDLDGFDVAARLTGGDDAPAVVLVSSREARDFGPRVSRSGARGFVSKADLTGAVVRELAA